MIRIGQAPLERLRKAHRDLSSDRRTRWLGRELCTCWRWPIERNLLPLFVLRRAWRATKRRTKVKMLNLYLACFALIC